MIKNDNGIICKRFNNDNVPILSDKQIEQLVNNQLLDYDPNYFNKPHSIDLEDFAEFYLNKGIYYCNLSCDKSILGITTLNDGWINIIKNNEPAPFLLNSGEICIDLDACRTPELFRFTLAHELGHSILHAGYKLKINHVEDCENTIKSSKKRLITSNDWIEHHANVYASCLLMPNVFIKKMFDKYYEKPKNNAFSLQIIEVIEIISKELKVSTTAVAYRLKNLGLLDECL